MKLQTTTQLAIAAMSLAVGAWANAVTLTPVRCNPDNLPQWSHDLDPAHSPNTASWKGSARGRNQWWKVCNPVLYYAFNEETEGVLDPEYRGEFDPTANHNGAVMTRWYPTFGVKRGWDDAKKMPVYDLPGGYMAPTSEPPSSGDPACSMPPGYKHMGMCASGCLTPDQEILTAQAYVPIENLADTGLGVIVPNVQNQVGETIPVKSFIQDIVNAEQKIIVIHTQSGVELRTSVTHPLLNQEYVMVQAQNLKAGDSLVKANGQKDLILSTEVQSYYGKLHNLTVDSSLMEKSLYVVRGYISGDKKFQDESLSDTNRRIFRTLIGTN